MGFVSNLNFNAEKLVFYSFQNPNMHTCVRKSGACVSIHVSAYICPTVSMAFIFQKYFYSGHKNLYLWCLSRTLASNFSGWLMPLGNTRLPSLSLLVLVMSCLGVTLVFVSISTSSIVPIYSFPSRYVYKFWLAYGLCLHIQFLKDTCTSGLSILTYEEFLGERST